MNWWSDGNWKKCYMTEQCIIKLISDARAIISYRAEKMKNAVGFFNIFNVLGIERQEVFTHSYVIYSLFNHDSGHCMDTK